ncbi:MAG: GIY-YIG nuclease family protein [Candidatus Bathyarchaeota archaeon]|nr:GIY-YIG nuclease family protein [Candidatus Bathyarchaeota archaeon]
MEKVDLKGIYVLIIQVNKELQLTIGALGKAKLKRGIYAYVGSAQKNLIHRVRRHLKKEKRKFWHIDYLLDSENVKVVEVRSKNGDKKEECKIAQLIAKQGEAVEGFGVSDCHCTSHLFHIESANFLEKETQIIKL